MALFTVTALAPLPYASGSIEHAAAGRLHHEVVENLRATDSSGAPELPAQRPATRDYVDQHVNRWFQYADTSYSSPEQDKVFLFRVKASLHKLDALLDATPAAFQDPAEFERKGRTPLAGPSLQELAVVAREIDARWPGLLRAVLAFQDISKLEEFRADPRFQGLNFSNHPEASAAILKEEKIFAQAGLSPDAQELGLLLVAHHGFIGQSKRGEVTDEIFQPLLQYAIEKKDPDILKAYWMINVLDTAAVWEGLFTADFNHWFHDKYAQLQTLVDEATAAGRSARDVLRDPLAPGRQGHQPEQIALKRLILMGFDPNQIEAHIDRVFAGHLEARNRFYRQLARQEHSFSFWYTEMALSLMSPETQIKMMALSLDLADRLVDSPGQGLIDVNFYDIAEKVSVRFGSGMGEENLDHLDKLIAGLPLESFEADTAVATYVDNGVGGLRFEWDAANQALYPIFDPLIISGLDQRDVKRRLSELERQVDLVTEDHPVTFIQKAGPSSGGKVGVFPGSFDPLQKTHELLIEKALKEQSLDEIVLIISKQHITKPEFGTTIAQRLYMLEEQMKAKTGVRPRISIAVTQSGRYIEMSKVLEPYYPGASLQFLMGFDAFEQMFNEAQSGNTKEDLDGFFERHRALVSGRGYFHKEDVGRVLTELKRPEYLGFLDYINLPKEDRFSSSTEVRRRIRDGVPDNPLLPPALFRIIKVFGLYRKFRPGEIRAPSAAPVSITLVNLTSTRHNIITEPYGIYALLGDIRYRYGDNVSASMIDTQFGMSAAETVADIKSRKPQIVGLSAQLESNERLFAILNLISEDPWFQQNPVLVVVGHNLPTNENTGLLSRYPFLITVRGEGEAPLRELVHFVRGEIRMSDVPAASYVRHGKIVENDGVMVSAGELAMPSRDNLLEILARGGDVMIETSRGCGWGNCAFCFKDPFRAHKWEPLPDDVVLDGLEYLQNMGARHVVLTDWEFFGGGQSTEAGLQRAYRLAQKMKARGITKLHIAFACRADSIYAETDTPEMRELKLKTLKLLYEVGFQRAFLGLESGSDSQLIRFRKGTTARQNAEAVRLMRELKFNLSVGFIPMDPYVTLDEIRENIKFLRDNNLFIEPAYPLNQLKIQPNTQFYNLTLNDGLLGDRQANLHMFNVRYQHPEVQKIADAIQVVDEIGSVFYVLKYMYRTKFLNHISGDEDQVALLRTWFEEYNKMQIDYLEALVESVMDPTRFSEVIEEYRLRRFTLADAVGQDIEKGRLKDENHTLQLELTRIRPQRESFSRHLDLKSRQAA